MKPLKRLLRWIGRSGLRLYLKFLRITMVGDVKGKAFVHAADFAHPIFGESRAFPAVLEIVVDDDRSRAPADVGRLAKRALFADDPRFLFNVVFSCGDPAPFQKGLYTDPRSIWFNVFFGYYELDAPCALWNRPLGYRSAAPGAEVEFADIVRIGKADWNYFSNRVYGVPLERIRPHDAFDLATIGHRYLGRERIGESWWDRVALDGVEVASAYTAPGEQGRLERPAWAWTPAWRLAFGGPCPRSEATESFFPTKMRAELYMSFQKATDRADVKGSGEVWRTLIFGGTVRSDYRKPGESADVSRAEADAFLAVQLETLREVMADEYAKDGFASAAP
jgi:hypothetical protein